MILQSRGPNAIGHLQYDAAGFQGSRPERFFQYESSSPHA